MRRKASQLSDDETWRILTNGSWGVLATADVGGQPYAVPMSYVLLDSIIYLHSALDGRKIDNMAENESVSFLVVENSKILADKFDMSYKSAMIFGKARIVGDTEEKRKALVAFIEKYSPSYFEAGMEFLEKNFERTRITAIEIQEFSGKEGT